MNTTCGTCAWMMDDGDGSSPYCAIQDLYSDVDPDDRACGDWTAAGDVDERSEGE